MSVIRRDGTKIVLHRTGPDAFWDAIDAEFTTNDPRCWRYLAMLALRENAGWPVERIGRAFGHNKGHITRCLERIKQQIRDRFNTSDLWVDPPAPAVWPDPTDRSPPPGSQDWPLDDQP